MRPSLLSSFQKEVLEAFFRREQRFFLSGGAALAGFHLGHRPTNDLDLFTADDLVEDGERAVAIAAADLGATLQKVHTTPDFRRRILRRGGEAVVVDLIRDRVPQGPLPKLQVGNIQVDTAEEILANKLCTLLSRSELRDLVDVFTLERAGFRVDEALPLAALKDGSLSPAQLAWVLSQVDLTDRPEEPVLRDAPHGPTRGELGSFVGALEKRLLARALPTE